MAVPSSDRVRRPFLLSLSLFLFISAALVLLFLFLDPSPGSLAFLPSRVSASAPSAYSPQQQSLTPVPARGSPPHWQPAGPLPTANAEREASQPPAAEDARGGSGSPGADDSSGARGVEADAKAGTSVAAAGSGGDDGELPASVRWQTCSRMGKGVSSTDYIPCLDNEKAVKKLRPENFRRYEHRERHCPDEGPTCLVPLPSGYRRPIEWPKSRDRVLARSLLLHGTHRQALLGAW